MERFEGRVAVITGAAGGFGQAFARLAFELGMKLVLADVERDALDVFANELDSAGCDVVAHVCDVRNGRQVEALAAAAVSRFGCVHVLINNAGVGVGGYVWETSEADWEWVLGTNLFGVIHGVRVFTPLMLAAARQDAQYEAHIVNTASIAGLINAPLMGAYNVSKHAVVSLSETLHHDLALTGSRVRASVLCPYFVPTGIASSRRNRPDDLLPAGSATMSQELADKLITGAVAAGTLTPATIAEQTFEGIREDRFYICPHPDAMALVSARMRAIEAGHCPADPYEQAPTVREMLKAKLAAIR